MYLALCFKVSWNSRPARKPNLQLHDAEMRTASKDADEQLEPTTQAQLGEKGKGKGKVFISAEKGKAKGKEDAAFFVEDVRVVEKRAIHGRDVRVI